jgi:hypothetical protein
MQVLDHFAASSRTLLAGLGTFGHVFVLREFGACRTAIIARLCTDLANEPRKVTVAGG